MHEAKVEIKYHVTSLISYEKKLTDLGATKDHHTISTHYYAKQPGNDVTKLVVYPDHAEIHEIKE